VIDPTRRPLRRAPVRPDPCRGVMIESPSSPGRIRVTAAGQAHQAISSTTSRGIAASTAAARHALAVDRFRTSRMCRPMTVGQPNHRSSDPRDPKAADPALPNPGTESRPFVSRSDAHLQDRGDDAVVRPQPGWPVNKRRAVRSRARRSRSVRARFTHRSARGASGPQAEEHGSSAVGFRCRRSRLSGCSMDRRILGWANTDRSIL